MQITFYILFLLKGMFAGFCVAAPIGPISILCIQRVLTYGKKNGIVSGIGAATADVISSSIIISGLLFISEFIFKNQLYFCLAGAVFLCYLGIKMFFFKLPKQTVMNSYFNFTSTFLTTFFLAIINPIAILSFAVLFSGICSIDKQLCFMPSLLLVIGVFIGSMCWWFILVNIAQEFFRKLAYNRMIWANRIIGVIIMVFGLLMFLRSTKV